MKRCPKCKKLVIVDTWKFCDMDGTALMPERKCSACGSEVSDLAYFCPICGSGLPRP